jgi:multidrug resistance efflux pump
VAASIDGTQFWFSRSQEQLADQAILRSARRSINYLYCENKSKRQPGSAMVIVTITYLTLVYLLFFKFKLLPWNKVTQAVSVVIGVVILTGFLVGLQGLTPSSTQGTITGRIVEIAPQVSGRVLEVPVEPNVIVETDAVLFTIDKVPFEARVQELQARLALSELRLAQHKELVEKRAGSEFQLQQTEAETLQLQAQLTNAEFDLNNTQVLAPSRGMVPRLFLKPGMQVSPSRSVLTFVDTSELTIVALFQQKALQSTRVGDKALVNFPALPGRVFETTVVALPNAIGDSQVLASGQLPSVQGARMTRLYPAYISLPPDFPEELNKVGLAATVYIHTEGAGVVGIVAVILQWVGTSLDAII